MAGKDHKEVIKQLELANAAASLVEMPLEEDHYVGFRFHSAFVIACI